MRPWLAILLVFAALGARADEGTDRLLAAGVAEFTAAYQAWDGARFRTAAALFGQAVTNAPNSPTCFYWLGVAQFHLMLEQQTRPSAPTNQLAASAARDAALAALSRAVKLDETHAESHALLGTLYGMKIEGNLLRAARFGPRVQNHRKAAMKHGANNPRVRYLLGAGQFHTAMKPAALREALASFLAAEELFAVEAQRPGGPLEPRWGRSSCRTFMGRTYERLGEGAKAAESFRQALAEHPSDHWAREGLTRVSTNQ